MLQVNTYEKFGPRARYGSNFFLRGNKQNAYQKIQVFACIYRCSSNDQWNAVNQTTRLLAEGILHPLFFSNRRSTGYYRCGSNWIIFAIIPVFNFDLRQDCSSRDPKPERKWKDASIRSVQIARK